MGKKDPKPQRATVAGNPLSCVVCKHDVFWQRDVKLNTGAKELLGIAFVDQTASGLVCWSCGYVHLFVSDSVKLQDA
ncbi:hypothetical protein [Streptomyces oceani]|uniref:DNA-binding protein n=1 Tax=Streptomyces oceani TaxID=1075402 RepID=A0A1E7JVS8_9ACTN|nr:hypothetical protein [Streptomyces oceani]OEU94809.1 hypothetical protein AN216_23935 [Streptomyces oceani]